MDPNTISTDHRQRHVNENRNLVDLIPIPKVNPTFPGANDDDDWVVEQRKTGWERTGYLVMIDDYLRLLMVIYGDYLLVVILDTL